MDGMGEEPFRFAWGSSFKQLIFFPPYFAASFVIVICVVTV